MSWPGGIEKEAAEEVWRGKGWKSVKKGSSYTFFLARKAESASSSQESQPALGGSLFTFLTQPQ